jgi:hypothetical protein
VFSFAILFICELIHNFKCNHINLFNKLDRFNNVSQSFVNKLTRLENYRGGWFQKGDYAIKEELIKFATENNKFDTVIQVLRSNDYPNIYFTEAKSTRAGMTPKTRSYGWNTNGATKYSMLAELKSAVEDGLLQLSDPDLIAELRSYTRDDLMDRDEDVRLTTRNFDLLIACAIAWQMRKYAVKATPKTAEYNQPKYESPLLE